MRAHRDNSAHPCADCLHRSPLETLLTVGPVHECSAHVDAEQSPCRARLHALADNLPPRTVALLVTWFEASRELLALRAETLCGYLALLSMLFFA